MSAPAGELSPELERQRDALERIEAAGVEWRNALEAAVDAGCAPAAIQSRVTTIVSQLFGVDLGAMLGGAE